MFDGLLVTLLAGATLVSLARRLPWQNVLTVAALLALPAAGLEMLAAQTGIPFGTRLFTENLGGGFVIPWPLPLLWLVTVLNARGVARLILRPWRRRSCYGFWVVGLTALLVAGMDFSLEPFATIARRWWLWQTNPGLPGWHHAPWIYFPVRLLVCGMMLVAATPWLIQKRDAPPPPELAPLGIWLGIHGCLLAGLAAHQLWGPLGFGLVLGSTTAIAAWRNGR